MLLFSRNCTFLVIEWSPLIEAFEHGDFTNQKFSLWAKRIEKISLFVL